MKKQSDIIITTRTKCSEHAEHNTTKGRDVMTVREFLKNEKPNQFHIFDSHQEAIAERELEHKDQDYILYSYNTHKNNKPKVGDAFLYRRPGKSTKNRKFNIYGGGIIKEIIPLEGDGNVGAKITCPFKLLKPLEQGDPAIENFVWTSRNKEIGAWGHFWNQYGMNVINKEDFFGLVGDMDCVGPDSQNMDAVSVYEALEEERETVPEEMDITGFHVHVENAGDDKRAPISNGENTLNGRHVDFFKKGKLNKSLGKAGEQIVLEMLYEMLDSSTAVIEYTADIKGDGTGYDIKVTFRDGHITYIEVKTTKSSYVDGFYISPRELSASKRYSSEENNTDYQIYRVYNFDPINKTASLKVYNAPFSEDKFRLAPTAWKVYLK